MGLDNNGIGIKNDEKDQLRYQQQAWVNELRSHIAEVSGFSESTSGYWLILEFAHYLHSRLNKRYISPRTLAYISWLLVQVLCGYVVYKDSHERSDSEILNELREYLSKLMKDDNDLDGFRGQIYHLFGGNHFGKKRYRGLEKYLENGVLSSYPRLPGRRMINQLSGVMTLGDCYDNGYYVDIQSLWKLVENDEKVELRGRVPRTIALQFRVLSLFCIGRPEDMLSTCIMHCWERLGCTLLHKCRSTRGLSSIFDELTKELVDDQSCIC